LHSTWQTGWLHFPRTAVRGFGSGPSTFATSAPSALSHPWQERPVIASEAKQSSGWAWSSKVKLARTPHREALDGLDCFATLAMTAEIVIGLF
jgi:hypothetical protein